MIIIAWSNLTLDFIIQLYLFDYYLCHQFLIHYLTENGLRHASGHIHAKHPIRYIYVLEELNLKSS